MLSEWLVLGKTRTDIFTHLLGEDTDSGTKFTPSELAANGQFVIVAGADTTLSVIANALRELALNPNIGQEKLYVELAAAAVEQPVGDLNVQSTKGLGYLQAVVDETLRLWNPIPAGVQIRCRRERLSACIIWRS